MNKRGYGMKKSGGVGGEGGRNGSEREMGNA